MAMPFRVFWLLVLGFHSLAAGGAFWMLPGGFPLEHPRFWSNTVAPPIVLATIVLAILTARRHRLDWLRILLASFPAGWGAMAIALRLLFPISFQWLFVGPLACALVMGTAWLLAFRRIPFSVADRSWCWSAVLLSGIFGAVLPITQKAPDPDTQPIDITLPSPVFDRTARQVDGGKLNPHLWATPGDGTVMVTAGRLRVNVRPLLSFISRSPDRCATIFAPPDQREGPGFSLWSSQQEGGSLTFWYRSDYEAILTVYPGPPNGPIQLEASAQLLAPIFSHLNSFCDFEVSGHTRLSLVFSPCPDSPIDVQPVDYPIGRPLRLAYRDASSVFHVVEATSGEKGPFHELASGTLRRLDELAMTLLDDRKPIVTIILEDWASQGDVSPSPSAGWGLPVNAIEFSLAGEDASSTASIYTTLAGTSVGRGWDSVGHVAGSYRNRVRIEFPEQKQAGE